MQATWINRTIAAIAIFALSGNSLLVAAEGDKKPEKSAAKSDAKTDKSAAKSDKTEKPKGPEHIAYADALWKYVTRASSPYTKWTAIEKSPEILAGPQPGAGSKIFANKDAATNLKNPPHRAMLVIEHYAEDAKTKKPALAGVTIKFRPAAGYDARHEDWYWAYYLPGGKHVECSVVTKPLAKCGFITFEEDGRLWVFRGGSKELADKIKNGELAAHVSIPGVGPGGVTVRGPDRETIIDYVISRPGFVTKIIKDQLWVLRAGSKEAGELSTQGPPAQHVTRPLAGPMGLTLRGPDAATLDAYLNAKSGFVTIVEDGRLWVFRLGSKDLAEYRKAGELAKQVVQPGAGPGGMTIKAPDKETIIEYLTARDGFTTIYDKDRLWVFRSGSDPLWKFKKDGELAQHVVRPAAGPMGLTVKSPDGETLDWYLRLAAE